jgi:hypothetical protein
VNFSIRRSIRVFAPSTDTPTRKASIATPVAAAFVLVAVAAYITYKYKQRKRRGRADLKSYKVAQSPVHQPEVDGDVGQCPPQADGDDLKRHVEHDTGGPKAVPV